MFEKNMETEWTNTRRAQTAVALALQAGVPVIAWGGPGSGKTAFLTSLATSLEAALHIEICSGWDPTDVGLPMIVDGRFKKVAPDWAVRVSEDYEKNGAILFLDEFSCTPPAVQAPALRMVQDGWLGDFKLPEGLPVVLAANDEDVAAGGFTLAPPMANRMCHIEWPFEAVVWADAADAGFPAPEVLKLPGNWKKGIPKQRAMVTSFIRRHPSCAEHMPDNERERGKAWASGRSWEMAWQLLAACDASLEGSKKDSLGFLLTAGCVGEKIAAQFFEWLRSLDLPDPEDLLRDPSAFELPVRGDQRYACLSSVVAAVQANSTAKRWENCWKVLLEASEQGGPDVAIGAAKILAGMKMPTGATPPDAKRMLPLFDLLKRAGWLTQGGAK